MLTEATMGISRFLRRLAALVGLVGFVPLVVDVAGCASSSPTGSDPDATPCGAPAAPNDPRCPAHYGGTTSGGKPCSPVGLLCQYPNEGDGDPATCTAATAMMICRAPGDTGRPRDPADAGDGGDGGDATAPTTGGWSVLQ